MQFNLHLGSAVSLSFSIFIDIEAYFRYFTLLICKILVLMVSFFLVGYLCCYEVAFCCRVSYKGIPKFISFEKYWFIKIPILNQL